MEFMDVVTNEAILHLFVLQRGVVAMETHIFRMEQ